MRRTSNPARMEKIECGFIDCACFVSSALGDGATDPEPAYCSDYCRERDDVEEDLSEACACGHPACDSP